jgi:hypothetical protein
MNQTPRTTVMDQPSFCKTAPKDNSSRHSPKFQTPAQLAPLKDCRDDDDAASAHISPIQMDFETPANRDAATNNSTLKCNECDTSFPIHDGDIEIHSPEEETEEQRLERESEDLARQLMAEEAMASYQMSSNFLRDHADQFSQEDLEALQAAMAEEDPEMEQDGEYEEDGEMSYDALLRLGERIGDVKEERWALVAKEKIESIPVIKFAVSMAEGKDENHTEVKCLVCQFAYEEGDELRKLTKCGHCFHKECIDEWLGSKDTCAFCRKSIVE